MKSHHETRRWLTLPNLVWLALYLLTMAAVVVGLSMARQRALADFANPEARAQWDEFRADIQKTVQDPQSPVARRVPKSEEPPTLLLLRDHYWTCLVIALVLTSALFGTFMIMVRGVFGSSHYVPRSD